MVERISIRSSVPRPGHAGPSLLLIAVKLWIAAAQLSREDSSICVPTVCCLQWFDLHTSIGLREALQAPFRESVRDERTRNGRHMTESMGCKIRIASDLQRPGL